MTILMIMEAMVRYNTASEIKINTEGVKAKGRAMKTI